MRGDRRYLPAMSRLRSPRLHLALRAAVLALSLPVVSGASCDEGGGGGDTGGTSEPAFVGSWRRTSLTVGGMSLDFCNTQVDLTTSTWASYTTGGGAMYCDCALSGSLVWDETTMTWTNEMVTGQYCGVAAPGDVLSFSWSVDGTGDVLTFTIGDQVETYARIAGGGGGGGGDSGGGGGTDAVSCDQKGSFGVCTDFVGDGWSDTDKEQFCNMGTLQVDPCDTTGSVGACTIDGGNPKERLVQFYADATPPFDAAAAENACTNLGGTWQPG